MKCPVCRNELESKGFTLAKSTVVNNFYCEHCECDYELRAENNKYTGWWKVTKLPVIPDDSDAVYKLYEIESVCTGQVTDKYPLDVSEFQDQRKLFAQMSSSYMDGEGYELIIAREDEIDENGDFTFDSDERVLCHQGDCGERFHKEAAANVKRWRDILGL